MRRNCHNTVLLSRANTETQQGVVVLLVVVCVRVLALHLTRLGVCKASQWLEQQPSQQRNVAH